MMTQTKDTKMHNGNGSDRTIKNETNTNGEFKVKNPPISNDQEIILSKLVIENNLKTKR